MEGYIPDEFKFEIIKNLPSDQILEMRYLNKEWYNFISNNNFWCALLQRNYGTNIGVNCMQNYIMEERIANNINMNDYVKLFNSIYDINGNPIYDLTQNLLPRNYVHVFEYGNNYLWTKYMQRLYDRVALKLSQDYNISINYAYGILNSRLGLLAFSKFLGISPKLLFPSYEEVEVEDMEFPIGKSFMIVTTKEWEDQSNPFSSKNAIISHSPIYSSNRLLF